MYAIRSYYVQKAISETKNLNKGVRIAPQILGGGQEKGMRSGTECVPMIAGFAKAVEQQHQNVSERLNNAQQLKEYFLDVIDMLEGVTVLSHRDASPYIISLAVSGIKSEVMLHFLESKGIYVSSGSACSKGKKSEVLKAFNVNERLLDFVIRISFSDKTTTNDIDSLVEAIVEAQDTLQKVKY